MLFSLPSELDEIKVLPQWVVFRFEKQDKSDGKSRMAKIPLNPTTGGKAMSNNSVTWATFDKAVLFAERHGYFQDGTGGIGFEFANGYAGIDLDNVINADGILKSFAVEIVQLMDSYTEISPSGKGLHILFKLRSPLSEGMKRRNDSLGLELYDSRRFFTITGKIFGEPKIIAERSESVLKVYDKYLAKAEQKNASEGRILMLQGKLTDNELWQKMFNSQHGVKIQRLYNGDISDYGSHSQADLALCNYLAFWCEHDYSRIDSMFRQSGLMRSKWDERHGAQTYGAMTISEAIRSTPARVSAMNVSVKSNDSVVVSSEIVQVEQNNSDFVLPITGFDYVSSGIFCDDLSHFQEHTEILSGFDNFDKLQCGFFPGMYILGATPSLGKTTFLLQVADNIAKFGNFVLYFSLEQSRLELTTKSLSRLTAERDIKNAVSSINIRRGRYINKIQRDNVEKAISDYKDFAANISIVELGFDATIATITNTVKKFMDIKGICPVVMIDYLQIVRPDSERLVTKDAVDYVVRALKKFQVDNNLVVIAISSFNRMNYLAPVDYESFKETGSLEYTADCMFGLQLQIMSDKIFDKDKSIKEKRESIDKAINEIPRKVILKNLKNRFGQKGYSCGFLYDCRFDLFVPDTDFKALSGGQAVII